MPIIKCKMCGGDIALAEDKTFGTCEYCGSTMTLPKVSDEQRAAAFNRGNHFRRMGEFDKALAVYERIVAEDDNDAEAHWCCALCRFGIEYVEDPATYDWLPTCHRASFDSFLEDVDYLAAVEHSDGITRRQYQKDAAKIAEVQRGILATSQNTEPYDVFISYKELDANGNRTRDSILAQDIYYQLTDKGWRVFFSRISLEDVPGTQYEPYIFAALNSAKVMIVVGTSAENLNAVWVKNEWSRYLSLMRRDRSKLLLPCYRDMDPYDLPEQLSVLMSYDMGKIGFIQDLIRGVDKVLNAEKPKEAAPAPTPVQERVIVQQSAGGPNVTALLKRGQQALEDSDWDKAQGFFDQVLSMDAENAEAFLGLALAGSRSRDIDAYIHSAAPQTDTLKLPRDEAYIKAAVERMDKAGYHDVNEIAACYDFGETYPSAVRSQKELAEQAKAAFRNNRNLTRAFRYAQGETKQKLEAFRDKQLSSLDEQVKNAQEAEKKAIAQAKERYAAKMNQADAKAEKLLAEREEQYRIACEKQDAAADENAYLDASKVFLTIRNYKDAPQRAKECEKKREELQAARWKAEQEAAKRAAAAAAKKRKRTIAITAPIVVVCIAFVIVLTTVIIPKQKLNKAMGMLDSGDYEAAYALLEEIGNSDAIASSKYDRAVAIIDSGDYEAAYALLEEIGNSDAIASIKYDRAIAHIDSGDYEGAYILLDGLDYRDSSTLLSDIKASDPIRYTSIGETVSFGSYEQDNNTSNGKEAIEWIVLAKEENRVLVISKYALDCQQYNTSYTSVTWETCSLRKWLNGTFINSAFSSEERARIPTVTVSADKNPDYSTSPGSSTQDQVFLLSVPEVNQYFSNNAARQCKATAYAKAQGCYVSDSGFCWWWLLSPGLNSNCADDVNINGYVGSPGHAVSSGHGAVRPALWIEIGE